MATKAQIGSIVIAVFFINHGSLGGGRGQIPAILARKRPGTYCVGG